MSFSSTRSCSLGASVGRSIRSSIASLPYPLAALTPPGRWSGPCPRQSVTSRSSSSTWRGGQVGSPGTPRRRPPGAGPGGVRREAAPASPATSSARPSRVVPSRHASRRPCRPGVEGVGVGAQETGRAREGLGDARAEGCSPARAAPRCGPGRGRRPGRRCAGRPRRARPSARGLRTVAGPGRAAGGGSGHGPAAMPASERARSRGPGPAGRSRPGRRGCGRAARPRRRAARRPRRGRRSGRRGRPPPGRRRSPTSTGTTSTGSQAQLPQRRRPRSRPRSAEPAWRPWSTVTAPARRPARGASKASAAARARESAPPLQADQHEGTRVQVGERRAYGPAYGRDRRRRPHAPDATRPGYASRRSVRPGARAGCDPLDPGGRVGELGLGREVLGAVPHPVEPVHADLLDDAADEALAVAVLPQLGVDAEQPADDLLDLSASLRRRLELRPDVAHRRDHRRADAVHDEVGVALEQRHHRGDAVEDLALRGGLHGLDERAAVRRVGVDALPHRAVRRRRRGPQPRGQAAGSTSVASRNARISLEQVVAQPRHGAELHPVGLLVQADPEPEVARVDAHLALGGDDVRARRAAAVPGRSADVGTGLRRTAGRARTGPSTLDARNASSEPVSTPVTLEPTRGRRRPSWSPPLLAACRRAARGRCGSRRRWPGSSPARSMTATDAPSVGASSR